MASIIRRPNGRHWIQFKGAGGKRRTIRLGKTSKRNAREFLGHVERLLYAKLTGGLSDDVTTRWLGDLDDSFHAKLAACGLIEARAVGTLDALLDDFRASLSVGKSTMQNVEVVLANLRGFFLPDRRLTTIKPAEANLFRGWLASHGGQYGGPLASATVSRRTRRAKQVFEHAVRQGWLRTNPFAGQRGWSEANRGRDHFVAREAIAAILEEVPNLEFRAIVALARFGGLRCPSEILPLEWAAIHWGRQTLSVYAPKTDTHRIVPLFPELDEALGALFESATEGATRLFPRHQITGTGLSSTLASACRRANVTAWPKPWQNMRSTRESELLEEYPIHVVAEWLGHSPSVALKHYTQVVKDHHARAVAGSKPRDVKLGKSVLRVPHR